jgi:hypothetical protein
MMLRAMLKMEKSEPSPPKYRSNKAITMEANVKKMPHAVQVPGTEVKTCWDFVSLYKTSPSAHASLHFLKTK